MRVTTMENCCGHILDKYTRQFSFLTANSVEVSRKIAREKEKNKLHHHHFMSIVCTIIDHRDQFRFLEKCPPTPPLHQHFVLSEK